MLCQKCNQRPATVFITQTVNQKTSQVHLCELCAGEQATLGGGQPFTLTLDPSALLKDFFTNSFPGFEPGPGAPDTDPLSSRKPAAESEAECQVCAYPFSQFKRTGRLGCPACYGSFAALLAPVLASVHGGGHHVAEPTSVDLSRPENSPVDPHSTNPNEDPRLSELRRRLQEAVAEERFEEAVELRDEIKNIKNGS